MKNVKEVLLGYVKNKEKWFYWYHNPKRLKKLYEIGHPEQYEDGFNTNVWRFESKLFSDEDGNEFEIQKDLSDFFDAELDEVRLKKLQQIDGHSPQVEGAVLRGHTTTRIDAYRNSERCSLWLCGIQEMRI